MTFSLRKIVWAFLLVGLRAVMWAQSQCDSMASTTEHELFSKTNCQWEEARKKYFDAKRRSQQGIQQPPSTVVPKCPAGQVCIVDPKFPATIMVLQPAPHPRPTPESKFKKLLDDDEGIGQRFLRAFPAKPKTLPPRRYRGPSE
jgi:hypothetical protein